MNENNTDTIEDSKKIIAPIIGISILLITIFGSAYAYFSITTSPAQTNATSSGVFEQKGNVVLETNTSNLYLNLNGVFMSESNIGTKYWATTDTSGIPFTNATLNNGIYTLATVSLTSGETIYNCTYTYDVSASLNKPITDGSDEDIKVTFKSPSITGGIQTFTLKQLLSGGQKLTGKFKKITTGISQTITIESTVENTSDTQDDFSGNNYSITLTPRKETEGFNCVVAPQPIGLAKEILDNYSLWQSGLEDDGYRYIGSGNVSSAKSPDNFICFVTTSLADCKSNEEKYLYRIIGVFEDSEGRSSVKLIKYIQIPKLFNWHNTSADVLWQSSDLYKAINGTSFLRNTSYDYMQNSKWFSKIMYWSWNAVTTKRYSESGISYTHSPVKTIYLHEMNKSSKSSATCNSYHSSLGVVDTSCLIGSWTNPQAKIGLMYASDYALSLGESSKNMIAVSHEQGSILKNGWIHQINQTSIANYWEWVISRDGFNSQFEDDQWYAVSTDISGDITSYPVNRLHAVRPVFYLSSNVQYLSGTGDYADPFMIAE